ncbi:MAG: hypothetical protein GF344_08935 [Chitinivibrionales bacterium]|nr:hypothetical protein [Chitinivibrionales bacterium]MBD3356983.1 hypothetical protein [Chitinivibrionales bacterium]
MNWKTECKPLLVIAAAFPAPFFLPVGIPRFNNALFETPPLVKWYAREHALLCLIPAFFIAEGISLFGNKTSVPKYLVLQGLIDSGMGKGSALTPPPVDPALSLPSILVLHGVMGLKKAISFIILVVTTTTISGLLYGQLF